MAQIVGPLVEPADPRTRRTRYLLHAALAELLRSKPFGKISVGDITAEAAVNRATFYAHYPDKFALLEGFVGAEFQAVLTKRQVRFDGSCPQALQNITLAMCDYLAGLPGAACAERRELDSHFESALMAVVRDMLLCGLRARAGPRNVAPELIAATISGAIYGGANEWVRTPDRGPLEGAVDDIFTLIAPMLATG